MSVRPVPLNTLLLNKKVLKTKPIFRTEMHRTAFRETGQSGVLALRPAIYTKFILKFDKCCYKVRQLFQYKAQVLLYYKVPQLFIINSAAIISKCETIEFYASFGAATCKKEKQKEKRFEKFVKIYIYTRIIKISCYCFKISARLH